MRSACSSSRQAATLAGPHSSPPCGTAARPARPGDPEGRHEVGDRAAPLVVAEPEPGHPVPGVPAAASRARVRASSGCLVRLAATMTPMPTPVAALAWRGGVQHQLQRRRSGRRTGRRSRTGRPGSPASPSRRPARPGRRLGQQPPDVGLGAHDRPGDVIQPLEAEPAPLVGRAEPGRPLGDQRLGQVHAGAAAASSTSVAWRIEPVKCRCRCALGSAASGLAIGLSLPLVPAAHRPAAV